MTVFVKFKKDLVNEANEPYIEMAADPVKSVLKFTKSSVETGHFDRRPS